MVHEELRQISSGLSRHEDGNEVQGCVGRSQQVIALDQACHLPTFKYISCQHCWRHGVRHWRTLLLKCHTTRVHVRNRWSQTSAGHLDVEIDKLCR